jgi:DNA mismatch endonuclease (patch repair protein)
MHHVEETMVDNLTHQQRRRCMQSIRSWDTQPEIEARRFLHRLDFRFRLHVADLPGCPDIVLPRYRTVIFVHGCFWHSHGCSRSVVPKSRRDYWVPKLTNTHRRDVQAKLSLQQRGWKVITIWECEVSDYAMLKKRCRFLIRMKTNLVGRSSTKDQISLVTERTAVGHFLRSRR